MNRQEVEASTNRDAEALEHIFEEQLNSPLPLVAWPDDFFGFLRATTSMKIHAILLPNDLSGDNLDQRLGEYVKHVLGAEWRTIVIQPAKNRLQDEWVVVAGLFEFPE